MHFLSSIVNSTLQIRTSKWRAKRERFLVSKEEFNFKISSGKKNYLLIYGAQNVLPIDLLSKWRAKRERFLASKEEFNFRFPAEKKLYLLILFSLSGFMLSIKRQS